MNRNITYVTGIWDIGRGEIGDSFKRPYNNYLDRFSELLETDCNLFIYCSKKDNDFIWSKRSKENTFIKNIELEELWDWFGFSDKVDEIRTNERWFKYISWLEDSPQAKLKYYNIIVLSKMFLLNDTSFFNPFESEYFFWIDAGLTNTVSSGYFTHDKVLDYVDKFYDNEDKFLFISFPYDGNKEIHGFRKNKINVYADTDDVKYVCRGGFFGGKKEHLNNISSIYYNLLNTTLNEGLMGTEESLFLIITHLYPDLTQLFKLKEEDYGLISPFFEFIKNNKDKPQVIKNKIKKINDLKISLYVIGYNAPSQFYELCESIEQTDSKSFKSFRKILLNNSTNKETDKRYDELCEFYGFEQIKKDNIGICGGRQFIAEHFAESNSDYMYFFEDDMFFHLTDTHCVNGFKTKIKDIFKKTIEIIHKHNYDFLKLQYTELYGDNGTQWSWYNLPQDKREKYFPEKPKLPKHGLDNNAPRTKFNNIYRLNDLSYIDGDVYYCNWPHIIGKNGTDKIFIQNKYEYPYEQTWMSLVFQLRKEKKINSAVLLLSPINHNRFVFYEANERKEN